MMRALIIIYLLAALYGSAAFAMGAKPSGKLLSDSSGRIQIAGDFDTDQQNAIIADFNYLEQQKLQESVELNQLLHLERTDSRGLLDWLGDRVHYIVAKGESASTRGNETVVMMNLGAYLYMASKNTHTISTLTIADGPTLSINSPRVGILQAGKGLFLGPFAEYGPEEATDFSRIFRLATLFHEARHSDGNGNSLAFTHDTCPAGHVYENNPACDRNVNGPYTIGGNVTLDLASVCTTCSKRDLEILRLSALDSLSRVIRNSVADMQRDECAYLAGLIKDDDIPSSILSHCATNNREGSLVSGPLSSVWDENPESISP